MDDPWDLISRPSDEPSKSAARRTVGKAFEPITSYPQTYLQMMREGRDQMVRGYQQLTEPAPPFDPVNDAQLPDSRAWRAAKGAVNLGFGAAEYTLSPINAGLRTIVGKPFEENFGIPKEYTEFAASLAMPGFGMTGFGPAKSVAPAPRPGPPTYQQIKEAAEQGLKHVDENPAASTALYEKALGNKAAVERTQSISKEFHDALTAAHSGKAIRDRANALLMNDEFLSRLSKEQIDQLQRIADGTTRGNVSGSVAKELGNDGAPGVMGAWSGVGAVLGGKAGAAIGEPLGGAALGFAVPPLAGVAFRRIQNASGRRDLEVLKEMSRKDAPLYRDMLESAPLYRDNTLSELYRRGLLQAPLAAGGGAAARGSHRDDNR
jgi:hypothetical protein